jgi:dihydroorotate dehydrogenase electron transfer subunit
MNQKLTIVSNKKLTNNVYELVLKGDLVNIMHVPGQFIHIQVPRPDLILRRPISLAKIDHRNSTCTVVLRASGQGTQSIVDTKVGDSLNVMGPLGNGFPIDFLVNDNRSLLIGGGIGIPPLLECAKQLYEKGVKCTIVLGFINHSAVFYETEFKQYGEVMIATDDGSYQIKGNVKTVIDQLDQTFNAIYACGPTGLTRMVNEYFKDHPNAYISLEERMACGIGACAGCTVTHVNKRSNYKVCSDGPVFKTNEVII